MVDSKEAMKRMEARIAELPVGCISRKTIKGKIQHYLQWRENGKVKSKYIRDDDVESVRGQIEERKQLQKRLRELQKQFPEQKGGLMKYETHVVTGEPLRQMVKVADTLKRRDCFADLQWFLYRNQEWTKVCAVSGLRRTGKTTMLFQAIAEMSEDDFAKTAYAKMRTTDTMDQLSRDLQTLYHDGYQYVFVDEVTLLKDFISNAALLSDIYSPIGMRIVLSGTDSLGFRLAERNELYDRVHLIHTTWIPFREYSRLLGIDSIDEYIRYGGMLSQGELAFDDEDAKAEGASFRDEESTRRYIDTAISRNIQHSLAHFEEGSYFGPLKILYEKGELTGAINRIIEDMNHRFLLDVLTRDFVSHDLGISARNLAQERDPEKKTDILYAIDQQEVTEKLMRLLDIRNKAEQTAEITDNQVALIKQYLDELDLIITYPIRYAQAGIQEEQVVFTQPGMRYCQAQALVWALMQDPTFGQLTIRERTFVTERILEEVRGRMLEDIVLSETMKELGDDYSVFKYRFSAGEYDMVIYNNRNNTCAIYEIKHSDKRAPEQYRHLINEEMLNLTTPMFGTLLGKFVLYLGEDIDTEEGVAYRNAETFLKTLPAFEPENMLGVEGEDPGFHLTM